MFRRTAKRFYSRGRRHQGECYWAVLDPTPTSTAMAYLRVEGTRESMIFQPGPDEPETVLAKQTYVLSPCFAGTWLCWVEQMDTRWVLRAVDTRHRNPSDILEPFAAAIGRPMSLAAGQTDNGAWLAWEIRQGKKTRICLAHLHSDGFEEPVVLTDGTCNAYDPTVAVAEDDTLYVAYCTFANGNYRILLQRCEADGRPMGRPQRLGDRDGPCLYPSLWPRQAGGIWFSYTSFDGPVEEDCLVVHRALLGHTRHVAQSEVYRVISRTYAGVYDGQEVQTVPSAGTLPRGTVGSADGSAQTQIFEDLYGQAHLLLRRCSSPREVSFAKEDPPLQRREPRGVPARSYQHLEMSLTTLHDDHWSPVQTIVPRAHFELPISMTMDGHTLRVAFTEDARSTGWGSGDTEWIDDQSELGVGTATLTLDATAPPAYRLLPHELPTGSGQSIESPPFARQQGEYLLAMGQTHNHTETSVCMRALDRNAHFHYRFWQDVQHADFGAITDHDFNMWHTEMLVMRKLAEYYYFPGEFVALPAYEWTGEHFPPPRQDAPPGPRQHLNILYLGEQGDLAVLCATDANNPGGTQEGMQKAYAGQPVIAIPHQLADAMAPCQWHLRDPLISPVVELYQSTRGSYEQPGAPGVEKTWKMLDGHWALDALKDGHRFGFLGGGEHQGLALGGVLVKELTRTGLYGGLQARRTFATTGIVLDMALTANDQPMGSSLTAQEADCRLVASAGEVIRELHILRNGELVEVVPVGANAVEHRWHVRRRQDGEFWYCRVVFQNGEMAWTSPFWLEEQCHLK